MPRGSKIGERRGGRQRGTPNRRTVLVDRILAIASERPTTSACQFVAILVKDQELPADLRMAIARKFLSAGTSRAAEGRSARSSPNKRRKVESARPRSEPPGSAKLATLDILFGIVQDTTVPPDQRRKAASEAALHFLPKKPGIKRWWANAPVDDYGFAITPQIAAEYRDIKFELRRLAHSRANSAAPARKAAKMREGLKAILHRLQCPCPSRYGEKQLAEDVRRLNYFWRQRDEAKIILSEKEDAEEAHRTARLDSFKEGTESAARRRLSILRDKERIFKNAAGPPLTWKERVDLRFLRLLYPQQSSHFNPNDDNFYSPLRDAPLAADGNLYPPDSKLRSLELKEEEFEEFTDVSG